MRPNYIIFLQAVSATGAWVAGVLFFRFWRESQDRLFAFFGAATALLVTAAVLAHLESLEPGRERLFRLTVALSAGFGKTAAPEVVRDCPQGGTVDVNSTSSGTSLNSTLAFSDCNGIDGNLTLSGTSSFTAQEFRYDLVMDGNLEERCEVTYDDFRETITTNLQGGANQATVVMNGQITARCSNGNTTCSFNNTQLNTAGDNSGLFAENCN